MTQEQMRNLNTIVETYGNDAQEDMAIEECSELVKAILKFRRSQIDTVNKDKVGDYIGQCSMAEMKKIDAALAVSIGIGINIKSNDLVKKWAEAANEAVKPDEKEPEPIAEKVEMPDVETQLEIAKITAERDVYKRLYEEAMARR